MEEIIEAAIDAMRDDPFQDDIPLMGTSQQDARMDHYARAAIAAIMPAIGERMAQEVERDLKLGRSGYDLTGYKSDNERTRSAARKVRALASTMAEEVGKG